MVADITRPGKKAKIPILSQTWNVCKHVHRWNHYQDGDNVLQFIPMFIRVKYLCFRESVSNPYCQLVSHYNLQSRPFLEHWPLQATWEKPLWSDNPTHTSARRPLTLRGLVRYEYTDMQRMQLITCCVNNTFSKWWALQCPSPLLEQRPYCGSLLKSTCTPCHDDNL